MSEIFYDGKPQTVSHLVQMTAQEREVGLGGPWVNRIPTGMAWGECSCGVRVEGSHGEPLPHLDVKARLNTHLAEVSCPTGVHGQAHDITSYGDGGTRRLLCEACGQTFDGGPLGDDL